MRGRGCVIKMMCYERMCYESVCQERACLYLNSIERVRVCY